MTAQVAEILHYDGQKQSMCSEPLGAYFALAKVEMSFDVPSSALFRGYVGEWEIRENRLYLIGLTARLRTGSEVNLATLFPDFPGRVFAHWFSGRLRVPQGKLIKYVHMAYASTYENDLFIDVTMGVVERSAVRNNGTAPDNAPEGYRLGAMTYFGSRHRSGEVQP